GLKAATNKQKYEKIGERKQHTGVRELCDGYPIEFATYLSTVRKYAFEETPDYNYLRGLFDTVLAKLGETNDGVYDWMLLNNGYGYAANSSVVSATRQEGARARNSGAYKTANPNHVSNQAMHSFDNNGQGPSTPNLDNSASNTPGKHSREQVNAADSKGVNQQKPIPQTPADSKPGQQHQQQVNGKVNGLGHQTPDGAAAGNTARNGNGAAGGHNEKQGFMSKIISAFGCCSSSSV
ncbi:Palmitoylated plasma membrane-bound casein kinase, partial [Dipsacomyces acuminosporus]